MYITKINLDGSIYSAISTIKKLNLDGILYDIGLNTSDSNAIASDIKQGKTAYVKGNKITGSMPPYGPQTITPTTKNQSFGPGVYLNGQITVLGSTALIPGNIKSGVNIFGVIGSYAPTCSIAIAIGSAENGVANLQYLYSESMFASISNSTITITSPGSYKIYAYGINPSNRTGTYSNRYLKIFSNVSGNQTIGYNQPAAYYGYAIWNGTLAYGDRIQATWESYVHNNFGMPVVSVAISKS